MKNSEASGSYDTEGFVKVCSISDLADSRGRKFIVNDIEIALFKINSEIFALNNTCPHKQSRLIYDGFIEDSCVICPAHGWSFNLRTGRKPSGSRGLETYPAKIFKDEIFVKVIPKKLRW